MLLSDVPVLGAHHAPDVDAIIFGERRMTYVELRDRCWRLSNALAGVAAPGDRVAILAENCPEYAECYYGVPGRGHGAHPAQLPPDRARTGLHHRQCRADDPGGGTEVPADHPRDPRADSVGGADPAGRRRGGGLPVIRGLSARRRAGGASHSPFRERSLLAALHLRHDGPAQGRDALAPQPHGRRPELHEWVGVGGRGGVHVHLPAVPCRRLRHAALPPARLSRRPDAQLRSGDPARGGRATRLHQHGHGAHHGRHAAGGPEHRPLRPLVPAPPGLRGLGHARRGAAPGAGKVAEHRLLHRLWHDRAVGQRHGPVQGRPRPGGRAGPADPGLGRPADAARAGAGGG